MNTSMVTVLSKTMDFYGFQISMLKIESQNRYTKNIPKSEDKIVTTICLYDGQKSLSCHAIWGEFLYFTIANVGNTHASNSEQ